MQAFLKGNACHVYTIVNSTPKYLGHKKSVICTEIFLITPRDIFKLDPDPCYLPKLANCEVRNATRDSCATVNKSVSLLRTCN